VRAIHLLPVLLLASCVDHHRGRPVTEPEFYAKNVKDYGETAAGLPPETVYAWDLRVAGDTARYYECSTIDTCSKVERSRAAADLLGIERGVGKAEIDGEVVHVMKLSLAARPTYVVPNWKPAR